MACQSPVPPAAKRGNGRAMTHSAFPDRRLRRTRRTGWSRAMVREHRLTPSNLIWPLFVCDGSGAEEPVASLPGVSRWSVDLAVQRAKDAVAAGIPCLALFPYPQAARRRPRGPEALNPANLIDRRGARRGQRGLIRA